MGFFALFFAAASVFGLQSAPVDTGSHWLDGLTWLAIAFGCLLALAGCGWAGERLRGPEPPAAEEAGPPAESVEPAPPD